MGDPNTIATLVADSGLAGRAFSLPHNRDRYRYLPTLSIDRLLSSRENTPFPDQEQGDEGHRLELTFDKTPQNMSDGFVFGSDPHCDIHLGERKDIRHVSRRHFCISFDAQGRIILQDTSTVGTIVNYGGQAKDEIRSHFTWIIFPGFKFIKVTIPDSSISFRIQLANHNTCEAQYLANINSVFLGRRTLEENRLIFPLHLLDVRSQYTSAAASTAFTPRQGLIYLLHDELGRGVFGRVYKVADVSTGFPYAGKAFSQGGWAREVSIMRKVTHEHIVRFVDFREKPTPMLVMEYLPLGNLADQHHLSPITLGDTLALSVQALGAVAHLHSQGWVHRDIKPANILVSCRVPLIIKLADFGLAKEDVLEQSGLKTVCGTPLYTAPEIFTGLRYTSAVDIWSLGVVIFQFTYGLPESKSEDFSPHDWHRSVTRAVLDWDSDDLIDFLSDSMLQLAPGRRLPASKCLEIALGIDSSHQAMLGTQNYQIGAATPTEKFSSYPTTAPASERVEQVLECEDNRSTNLSTIRPDRGSVERLLYAAGRAIAQEDSSEQHRSQDSNSGADCYSSRKITDQEQRVNRRAKSFPRSYAISDQLMALSGPPCTMYEAVLGLLEDIQIGDSSDEREDSRTPGFIGTLCEEFKRLKVAEIEVCNNERTQQTILTAVLEGRHFVLASLTSSDLANSTADLAEHLAVITQLMIPDPQSVSDGSKGNASFQTDQVATIGRYESNSRD